MKLTAATLQTLTLPPGMREKKYFDERLGGHGVRVRHPSDRSKWKWITQYDFGGQTKTITHGAVSLYSPDWAFNRSKDVLAAVRLGHDPATEKREAKIRANETFGALLLSQFLPFKRAELRPRSFKELERHLCKYARSLHPKPITAIDQRTIATLRTAVTTKSGPVAAKCMLGSLSGYYTWLAKEGLFEGPNPVAHVNPPPVGKGRDRVLSIPEMREIHDALPEGEDYCDILRLLFYTLARKSEIGGLRWGEIDFDAAEIRLSASRCKNGRPHIIPLAPGPLAILEARRAAHEPDAVAVFGRNGQSGFSGWSFSKTALDARVFEARKAVGITEPMPPWVLHDIRRFGSTSLHDQFGIAPHIVEALLGHVAFRTGVSGVYNKALYLDERRRALERWGEHIEAIASGKPAEAKIVKLPRTA